MNSTTQPSRSPGAATTALRESHRSLPDVTDDMMRERLTSTKSYTVVILKAGPNYGTPGADRIIWEHGRRNMALRIGGELAIVCPVRDESEVCGVGIFDADPETVREILAGDPAVQAGVLTYGVHPARGFPGDSLPA
jgi:hypothetical protein